MLVRVAPAFAGLLAQPKVLTRFHAMVGGGAGVRRGHRDAGNPPPADAAEDRATAGQRAAATC